MIWSDSYVGIPYLPFGRTRGGCDCWGLACVVYACELGITLPDYLGYGSVEEHAEIAALIGGAVASPLWTAVEGRPRAFDIAVFRRGRLSSHVGIVIWPGLMLHMLDDDQAKAQGYGSGPWANRLTGHFRHASFARESGQ